MAVHPNRRFLYEIIGMGLELETVTPDDVIKHITPEILAHHLPVALKAKILQASLEAEKMTPSLIVEVVGIDALIEHSPMPVLWSCIRGAVERQLGSLPKSAPPAFVAAATSASAANGSSAHGDDLSLKPPKSARTPILRPSSRVSALSPRSRVLSSGRQEPTSPPPVADSPSSGGESRAPDEGTQDFEVVEETDVLRPGGAPRMMQSGDEDTRPGPKS